jgi:hypothetical protein
MFSTDNINSESFHLVFFLNPKYEISEIRMKVPQHRHDCSKGQTTGQSHISLELLAFN